MDGSYNMGNALNSSRLVEDPQYNASANNFGYSSMNNNYLMNGTGLANGYNNSEYVVDGEKYKADIMEQYKLEQSLNRYNNTMPIHSVMQTRPTDAMNMQGMKTHLDTAGLENYRNLINYNNTQHSIQANQMPYDIEGYNNNSINNNNGEAMYMNPNTSDMFPTDYINNLPGQDTETMLYSNSFNFPNTDYNTSMLNNNNYYGNSQYPMPIFENMNNPKMYMQHMDQNQNIDSAMPKMGHACSIRKMPIVNKRRSKQKKLFPCC
ncbi:conserved Plasmodium protein, unknown function [Plasmodium vinckei brucechwatti]|uniref:Uncharacterized protein n=1 Tax=Plasmodium vinckei brucechwatti TaxID=119398 RepID=A0A6V7S5R9_PLAVN|nr:conserved Plasmodium protein, unknown function [Plasmodium vinckei brucechwatti]